MSKVAKVIILMILLILPPAICYATNYTPANGSISPSSGTILPETATTFTTTYSDSNGWADLKEAYLLINLNSTTFNNCAYLYYDQNANLIYLRNDSDTAWLGGYAPGSSNIIENSQVKINCSLSTAVGSSTILTIGWNIIFKAAFSGKAYNTYLKVVDDIGALANWYKKGTYIINTKPVIGTITPASGTGQGEMPQIFTATYTDADGWQNIQIAQLLINTSATGTNCFYAYYDQNTNKLFLRNDANTAWLGGYEPGSANVIENSYAKLNCASTLINGSGTTLTVNWSVILRRYFNGTKNTYLYVKDDLNTYAGLTKAGTWTLPNSTPQAVSIAPSSGTGQVNLPQMFTATFTDADGWQNISYVQFLINSSVSGSNCFYGYYSLSTNKLYIRNDANTVWLGGYAPGSANIIENSYAKLDCSATTVSTNGTNFTINWSVTLKQPFTGNKNSYLYIKDIPNSYQGFIQKGTWSIPNNPPSLGAITPASGSSLPDQAVTFTATYSDSDTWLNLQEAHLLINATAVGKSCFYAYYNQNTNKLYLRNDANTGWAGGYAPGSNNVIQNSYVKLNCATTTISGAGNDLAINWSVSFKPIFLGNKNAYLYVKDDVGSYISLTQKGTWSINAAIPDNPPVITPTLISSVKGATSDNMLGYSCLLAKNINGDGANGIIISAPGSSTGTDIGRVYVYFGSDLTKSPDLTLTGSASEGCFGYSMAVGDINKDGCDDIIIGEPYNDENGTNSGKVYIYFGGSSLSDYPDITLKGQAAGDMFGYSVSCRDINNDNRDDIIIGAPYNSSNGANAGKVYVYFGDYTVNAAADVIMAGAVSSDLFGYSIASADNIDGNGDSGIIVGAPGLFTNTDRPGKAYVYFGGTSVSSVADLVMTGQINGDLFGCSVSTGDFNGDGCDDIIVGAEKNSTAATAAGKAYVYYGGKNMVNTTGLTLTGELANDRFGHLVACAGDLNGDGYSDIIVDSPNDTNATGKAYLYFGGLFMDNTADTTIKGEGVGDNFGSSFASVGGINNDGIDELIIGAANNSLNGTNAGKAYLYKIVCSGQPTRTADALLDETEAKVCKYFYDQMLTTTGAYGLVKDTCYTNYSSTAATGFGLTSLCIMASRYGSSPYWTITPAQAQARVSATLDTLINIQNNQSGQEDDYGKEGFFFHFIGPDGKRETSMNSEVSTVDTALLLAGVIAAGKYFGGDIQTKANTIFSAANWGYFLDPSDEQFYHGWSPDYGLIQQTWDRPSDETLLISLLAIASDPTNQDFLKAYYGFPRSRNSYTSASQTFYVYNSYSGSLFTYIFAHCWYDFKKTGIDIPENVQGARFTVPVNWWENSKTAAQANRQFCIDNAVTYSSYSQNDWGLSACFRPDKSYFGMNGAPPREYVAPDGGEPANDGTVPPYGAISTLPLMKDLETSGLSSNLAYQALAHYYNDYYFRLWGPYGPRDSFNQLKKFSTIYTGINIGPIALMIENYRSELLWNTFMADSKIAQVNHVLFTDTMAPVINQFSVSNPSSPTAGYTNSATVNVSIDGSDAGGIAKWLITETATQPTISDFTGSSSSSKPISYTIVSIGNGLKRLYAWAMDGANNISLLNSNSQAQIYLDTTAPAIGAVVVDGPYTASSTQLHAKWSGDDSESGVIEYQYSITDGSTTGTVIRNWTSTGTVPEVTATGLTLTQNHTYYFGIKARNGAGSWSATQYSSGIIYNPLVPDVTGVNPNDGAFGYASTTVSVYPTVNNPNGYSLQYQFTIKGVIKQAWTTLATYSWAAAQSDAGSADIKIEAKNQYGTNYRTGTIYLIQSPIDPPLN